MNPVPKSNFTGNLLALNRTTILNFSKWSFTPGMAYGDSIKWWDRRTERRTRHEGLDFATYRDRENKVHRLGGGVAVPPFYRGRLVGVMDDFLGKTAVVEHQIANHRGHILYGLYAHLLPAATLETGEILDESNELGMIAPALNKSCPAHLHISTVWIARRFPIEQLSWAGFGEQDGFQPCDPRDFL